MFNEFNIKEYFNFFDEGIKKNIYSELEELDFELVSQERHGHYVSRF